MNNELHSLYDSLVSVLRKEIEVYRKLHDSLLYEKEILAGSSVNEIYENNYRKETCILKAKMVKEVRTKLLEKIISALNLDGRDIRLSTLLLHGDDSQKKELEECRLTLCSLLMNVNELSKRNKALLVSSLFYVRKSIDFLGQIISPGVTYLSTGKLKENHLNGKIVSREG
ncbi:MAG: hypothetical protein DRN30_04490 [Thermoplasmata archaeon]|nr:MAG: hypothetical protein DRN30_04490 [Thermoplasmata archaeon]